MTGWKYPERIYCEGGYRLAEKRTEKVGKYYYDNPAERSNGEFKMGLNMPFMR